MLCRILLDVSKDPISFVDRAPRVIARYSFMATGRVYWTSIVIFCNARKVGLERVGVLHRSVYYVNND